MGKTCKMFAYVSWSPHLELVSSHLTPNDAPFSPQVFAGIVALLAILFGRPQTQVINVCMGNVCSPIPLRTPVLTMRVVDVPSGVYLVIDNH